MKRGRTARHKGRKQSEKAIIEALEEGAGRWKEVYERVDMAKSTFNDSLKELENKDEVERYYDKERRATLVRLSEKIINPTKKTIRHLDEITIRSLLDLEKGQDLLSEKIAKFILSLQSLGWVEEPSSRDNPKNITEVELEGTTKSWTITDSKAVDEPVEKLDFTEYDLLKGLAPYYFESRFVTYHRLSGEYYGKELYETFNERWRDLEEKKLVEETESLTEREILKKMEEDEDFEYPFFENALKEFYEEEGDNPVFFPVKYICEEKGFQDEMEQLLKWLEPLLCAEPLEIGELKQPDFSDLGKTAESSTQVRKQSQSTENDSKNEGTYEPKTYEEKREKLKEYGFPLEKLDPRLGTADNLAAIVFRKEVEYHANNKLNPVWKELPSSALQTPEGV